MSKIDQSVLSEFINSVANLEVLYPFNEEGAMPPTEYTSLLTSSLFMNDASSLMKVFDTEDINPWGVYFVEDGLGEKSTDKQPMILFAARKKSWACVSALVEHYQDCRQSVEIMDAVEPSLAEYEVATDPKRIEFLECFMRAANSGYAKNLEKSMGFHVLFQPNYVSDYPKANRFMFKSFAEIDFSKKKLAPALNKRLALRQKTLAAIACGDLTQLSASLEFLKANSLACTAATRKAFDALTLNEMRGFVSISMGCAYPECVKTILCKTMEFVKSCSLVKSAGKKVDKDRIDALKLEDEANLLDKVMLVAKTIDDHSRRSNNELPQPIEDAVGEAVFSVLNHSGNSNFIEQVKKLSQEDFTVLKPCLEMVCARAQSFKEKQDITEFMAANDESVELPPKRASVRL